MSLPSTMMEQIDEILADLGTNTVDSLVDMDDPAMLQIARTAFLCLTHAEDPNARRATRRLASSMLWMFMIGREHHKRGYPSPAIRHVANTDPTPDYIEEWFGH